MTAVDYAELKRLAEGASDGLKGGRPSPRVIFELLTAGWEHQVPRAKAAPTMEDAEYIVAACRDLPALLSEIEGLKAKAMLADMMSDKLERRTRLLDEAARQLAVLRTQAPDSWRPDRDAVAWIEKVDLAEMQAALNHSSALVRQVPLYCSEGVDAVPLYIHPAPALRPQTAESGK